MTPLTDCAASRLRVRAADLLPHAARDETRALGPRELSSGARSPRAGRAWARLPCRWPAVGDRCAPGRAHVTALFRTGAARAAGGALAYVDAATAAGPPPPGPEAYRVGRAFSSWTPPRDGTSSPPRRSSGRERRDRLLWCRRASLTPMGAHVGFREVAPLPRCSEPARELPRPARRGRGALRPFSEAP